MVGFGNSLSARSIALIVFALARFSASLATAMRRIQSRSAPAENATPCPVRTTIRVSPSAPSVLNASVQRTDHSVVDCVAHLRPVDRDGGNAARVLGDDNRGSAHLRRLRHRRLSTSGILQTALFIAARKPP